MTGPEHYRAAEKLLDDTVEYAEIGNTEAEAVTLSHAQVHATLALAAATAVSAPAGAHTKADWDAWLDAASAHVRPGGTA